MSMPSTRSSRLSLDYASLQRWQRSRRGRRLLARERKELTHVLPELFGRHILQIGNWGRGRQLLASAEMLHHAVLGSGPDPSCQAYVDLEHLPIQSRSVDAVLLPHTLEFASSPHQLLREVERILTERGRLLILGFNPWSAWGVRAALGLHPRSFPGRSRLHGTGRLIDWLSLLDFELVEVRRFGADRLWNPAAFLKLLRPCFMLVAKKRVIPIDRIGRIQRAQVRPLIGASLPLSGARSERP